MARWLRSVLRLAVLLFISEPLCSAQSESGTLPFHLTYSPARISKGFTENVRLRCGKDADTASRLREVSRIRIMKKTRSNGWRLVAELTDTRDAVIADSQVTATGQISATLDDMFLEAKWPIATDDTFGIFRCDVIGFDGDLFLLVEKTSETELTDKAVSRVDLLHFISQMKADMKKEVSKNVQNIQAIREGSEVISYLSKDLLPKDDLVSWPSGEYALPQPSSGCPVDLAFYGGDTGYLRMYLNTSLQGEDNQENLETTSHLAPPLFAKYGDGLLFSLHFCAVTRVFSGSPWPEGSYCIHQKGGACPELFTTVDTDFNFTTTLHGGILPDIQPDRLCCKTSGTPQVPVDLPTATPFYLYRHADECQQVRGMDVTLEVVEIYQLDPNENVKFELCYYTKRDGN